MPLVPEVVVSELPVALEPEVLGLAPIEELPLEPVVPLVEGLVEEELLLDGLVVEGVVVEGVVVDEPDAPMELLSEDDGLLAVPEVEGLVLLPDAPMVLDEPVPGCCVLLPLEPAPPVLGELALLPAVPLLPVALPELPLLPADWATA